MRSVVQCGADPGVLFIVDDQGILYKTLDGCKNLTVAGVYKFKKFLSYGLAEAVLLMRVEGGFLLNVNCQMNFQ